MTVEAGCIIRVCIPNPLGKRGPGPRKATHTHIKVTLTRNMPPRAIRDCPHRVRDIRIMTSAQPALRARLQTTRSIEIPSGLSVPSRRPLSATQKKERQAAGYPGMVVMYVMTADSHHHPPPPFNLISNLLTDQARLSRPYPLADQSARALCDPPGVKVHHRVPNLEGSI